MRANWLTFEQNRLHAAHQRSVDYKGVSHNPSDIAPTEKSLPSLHPQNFIESVVEDDSCPSLVANHPLRMPCTSACVKDIERMRRIDDHRCNTRTCLFHLQKIMIIWVFLVARLDCSFVDNGLDSLGSRNLDSLVHDRLILDNLVGFLACSRSYY